MSDETTVVMMVRHHQPWQRHLTIATVALLRETTELPFTLAIGECISRDCEALADVYVHFPEPLGIIQEANQLHQRVATDRLVATGNDVFVRPGWLEALHECFEIPDCGLAYLAGSELGHVPEAKIVEGIYHPLVMTAAGWYYDEEFTGHFADSDLIMRVYESGKRAYRNHRVVVDHLRSATDRTLCTPDERSEQHARGLELFKQKHGKSKLLVYRALSEGMIL